MFNVEEIIGIKKGRCAYKTLEDFEQKVLLVPEAIEDTFKKINKMGYNIPINTNRTSFVNGYCLLANNQGRYTRFINKNNGKLISCDQAVKEIITPFSCDRAIARCMDNRLVYIDGLSGDIINIGDLKPNFGSIALKEYSNDLAVIKVKNYKEKKHCYQYIDKTGKKVSPLYLIASSFYNGEAIVKTLDNVWQEIDTSFNVLKTYQNDEPINTMLIYSVKQHDNSISHEENNAKIVINYRKLSIIDLDKNLNIQIYQVIEVLSKYFGIEVKGNDPKEDLINLINEISKIGTFLFDLENMKVVPVKVKKGVKLTDNQGRSVISFDNKDNDFIKSRKRRMINE